MHTGSKSDKIGTAQESAAKFVLDTIGLKESGAYSF
jgi:hypothetical protein